MVTTLTRNSAVQSGAGAGPFQLNTLRKVKPSEINLTHFQGGHEDWSVGMDEIY